MIRLYFLIFLWLSLCLLVYMCVRAYFFLRSITLPANFFPKKPDYSKTNISWVRDRTFDDIIRVTGYSQLVTPGQNKSAIHCGLLCTSMSWCSSFFFLSATGGCILHQTVFAVPQGGQGTKGARYYRAFTGKLCQVTFRDSNCT